MADNMGLIKYRVALEICASYEEWYMHKPWRRKVEESRTSRGLSDLSCRIWKTENSESPVCELPGTFRVSLLHFEHFLPSTTF